MSITLTDEIMAPAEAVVVNHGILTDGDAIDLAWDAVKAALPLIEAVVRAEIEAAVEADAAGIEKAAEGWRASEQHPVNSDAATRYDRVNAEVREAMARHLRTVVIPRHVRGEKP